ncbi:MAG: AAA family ATPase [Candidatus Moranbacteria bacterium]|nr:AAA family ATPase [Candidatus Moranbacteria bacterium]
MTRGFVVGKFFPFHKGHSFLIEEAIRQSDEVTVAVCARSDQGISGETRAGWIRVIHPSVKVMVVPDIMKDDDSEAWAKYTLHFLGYRPDKVFTSESYGVTYAHFLGAEHVSVDPKRGVVPISATAIRGNLYGNWEYLHPVVRSYFVKRVVVVGAESTGTTTLSRALAEHFRTTWVPEFGRIYTEGKIMSETAWESGEFDFIAEEQNRMEDALARYADKLLFCDTDSWATDLWHERYLGGRSEDVAKRFAGRKCDLYLLTDADIPFVQDGLRDGKSIRHAMHARFREVLEMEGKPYVLLSGDHESRMKTAVIACESLFSDDGAGFFAEFPDP